MLPLPKHFDFIRDVRLSPEQVGALALMITSEGPFYGQWFSDIRPSGSLGSVGHNRSKRIIRELKVLGYVDVKSVRDEVGGVTRSQTSVRGNLTLPFEVSGSLHQCEAAEENPCTRLKAVAIEPIDMGDVVQQVETAPPETSSSRIVKRAGQQSVEAEIVEAEIVEVEIVEVEIATSSTKAKTRKPTIAEQTKAIRQDPRWIALLSAYREMLRGINKIGNLGEVTQAAKQFLELLPELDSNSELLATILGSLVRYQLACNGYPVRMKRFLEDRLWESCPSEPEIDWSKFEDD